MKEYHITGLHSGSTLQQWCKRELSIPHGLVHKLLRTKQIKVNHHKAESKQRLENGDVVQVYATLEHREHQKSSAPLPLTQKKINETRRWVLNETHDAFILNKPPGMAAQGGSSIRDCVDMRLDALITHEGQERPRLVHRLDKDTSGIMLLAKHRESAAALTEAFRARQTRKIYWALVCGVPDDPIGTINAPLGKVIHQQGEKMSVVVDNDQGQQAETHYRVVRSTDRGRISWVELRPITGRTHQLRVHMASIGHPILGDGKYGGKEAFSDVYKHENKLHLHARYIACPYRKKMLEATAPLPDHMKNTWALLEFPLKDNGVSLLEMHDL